MKKFLVVLLAVCMIFAFAACANNDAPVDDPENPDVPEVADPMDILSSGTFYMDYSMYTMGMNFPGIMAIDGDNAYVSVEVLGVEAVSLVLDGVGYVLDPINETYTVSDVTIDTMGIPVGEEDMEPTSTGNGAIPGLEEVDTNAYDYDEYATDAGTVRFYTNDGELYAMHIAAENEGVNVDAVMLIENFSAEIPEGIFAIPEGYTETTV